MALAAAPLGCFVVWRRMAYFGEATAHAAILGVALALAFHLPVLPSVPVAALMMAVAVNALTERGHAMDIVLGVMAHSALAFGLVAIALLADVRLDLTAFLFRDILAVSKEDLAVIWGGAAVVPGLMAWRWSALLTTTPNPDLARAAGLAPQREEFVVTLALATVVAVVAVAIKVVGILLIAALQAIPAAAARPLSGPPETMAAGAARIGTSSVLGGLWSALILDTPGGPGIVCVAALLFRAATLVRAVRGRVRRWPRQDRSSGQTPRTPPETPTG